MPLNLRASKNIKDFNVGVSYRINDRSGKFLDARNVQTVQKRLDTRFGTSRYNSISLGGKILSLSFFIKSDGSRYSIAKVGSQLFSVALNGSHTVIKSGLSANTVHRGVTGNDRHIIAIEGDGLYSWDGTTFTQLGQEAPTVPTVSETTGGTLTLLSTYKVALTFYASSIGFESSYQTFTEGVVAGSEVTKTLTGANNALSLTAIPATADNALIDKVYIYLKNVTTDGEYLFVGEVALGTTTFSITSESTSSQMPQINNGKPLAGGGKFLAVFNSKLVYAGNSTYLNEVYFSETDVFDGFNPFDSQIVLPIPGQGPVTGLGVGLYGESVLDPYLVIFKRKSTRIYSEIGGIPKMVELSNEIGCVSHDTIQVKNGVVYFLSEEGWRAISNGRIVTDQNNEAITLANGDVDDIFKTPGYTYEVNRNGITGAFSVYYPTLDQYLTWLPEASNNAYTKTYSYEFNLGGFKPYEFACPATCATLGEDTGSRDMVLFGTVDGYILKHSILEDKSDVDASGATVAINAFAVLPWSPEDGDFDATYNFRELILKAVNSEEPLTVKTFVNYSLRNSETNSYSFSSPDSGFILDESILDEDTLGDDRAVITSRADIHRVGETLAIGFYQSALDSNMGLISMQIDFSKNGNRNLSTDEEDDSGFSAEDGTYYPSVNESAQAAALSAAQAAAAAASITSGAGISYSGWSLRFGEAFTSVSLDDTLQKILILSYAAPTITLSCSPSQVVREKGTSVAAVTMSATTVKKSDNITAVTHFRNGVLVDTEAAPSASGGVETFTESTPFTDTMTFYSKVYDGTTLVQSNTVTYSYVYPYYSGAAVPGITAAAVAALTKSVTASSSSVNKSFTTANGDVYYFAYLASYGALTSIKDENNFETIGDWTLRTENITGLDASAVSYRIYEFNNPVVALTTDYTFIR